MSQIRDWMTASPLTIGRKQTLKQAAEIMHLHEVRHLPVLDGGILVGLLSDRDIKLVQTLPGVDPAVVLVDEAMTIDVYSVAPTVPLTTVAAEMAARRYGSTVVMERERVIGIFTTVDAMRALAQTARA